VAATADDGLARLSVSFVEDGIEKVRELDKRVLAHGGGWATIAFLFEEKDGDAWKPPKIALRRYRKRGGGWVVDSRFVVSSGEQARALHDAIGAWFSSPTS
jgi:hypothetical protein